MTAHYDIVVIGAGHNGLTCAAYLARAGRKVLVLEAAGQVGGAAVTSELAPGFRVSACAHILHMLHPRVVRELGLKGAGLDYAARDLPTVALDAEGRHLTFTGDGIAAQDAEALSEADRATWPGFRARLLRFAAALRPALAEVPPRLGTKRGADTLALAKLGWRLRRLGAEDLREFLRIAGINVADLLEENFENELLMGAMAFDAVLGTRLGPRSPGSLLSLLYRLTGRAAGGPARLALPRGGMGAVTTALARAAKAAGTEIRTECPVARILVTGDRASGVRLESGEEIKAGLVISNADPQRTFLKLLGPRHLDTDFLRRVRNIRMRGTVAKLNLALDGLPRFTGLEGAALGGRLVIAPDLGYLERAFDHAKYGEAPQAPALEITIPSLHDPGLAPEGQHVLSANVIYAPYDLKAGWDAAREGFAEQAIAAIAQYAPDLRQYIVAGQLLTPLDLEREYRLTGGHWHHGELALDQLLMLRPVPGAAQYATPLPGLYLCGAGAHPGGGVMGAAGMNAARQVLAKEAA
jgi:phytoene dehydrogenase-like protein